MKTTQHILKAFVYLFCILSVQTGFAQNVGISSSNGFVPDASAGLDISYTNKGLLVPRVALTATNAVGPITSPAISLLVYNTATAGTSPNNVTPGYYYWNGTLWTALSTSTTGWSLTGNAGTSYLTNFLGTTDNNSLRFRTNNTQRFLLDSLGNAEVGLKPTFNSANPEKLLVDAGTTSSTNVISGKGSINSFLQLNIQNTSAGTNASTDVVATADNGTNAANYVDMGINSSGNKTSFYFGSANDAYLYNAGGTVGGNFYIGTSTSAKFLAFLTGGSAASNERMRIDGTGNVGIGTITPTQKLDVNGSINASTSVISQGTVVVDASAANTGTSSPGLLFGSPSSGEAISSKRTTGTDQYGIDFYTGSTLRMSVTQTGNVGIGTNVPASTLDVQGTVKLGVGGTPFNNIMRGTFTITNSTVISNGDKQTSTVTINGVTTGANVILNPQAALPGAIGIASVRVSAANTIVIAFINTSTTALAVGTVTFTYTIIQ